MKNNMKRILLHISLLGATSTMCAMWQEPLSQEELQKLKQQAISLSGQYHVEQPAPQQPRTHVNVVEALCEQTRFLCDQYMRQYHSEQGQVEEPKYPTAERNRAQEPNPQETKKPFAIACEKDDIKSVEALLEKEKNDEYIATVFVYHAHTVQVVRYLLEKKPKLLKPYLRHRFDTAAENSLWMLFDFLKEKYDFEQLKVDDKTDTKKPITIDEQANLDAVTQAVASAQQLHVQDHQRGTSTRPFLRLALRATHSAV